MDILDKIIAHKKQEVARQQELVSLETLQQQQHFQRETLSLSAFLQRADKSGIIAEFKRQSPSKGVIHATADVQSVTQAYSQAGASGLSVLTDHEFFGGAANDLTQARAVNATPILRKDFIISEYQIYEAKAIGADVILLIAAALDAATLARFTQVAHELQLEVLLEIHSEEELEPALAAQPDLIGVNNRNLKTFITSLEVSRKLITQLPKHITAVSESGISSIEAIIELKQLGYRGFLMGEKFMQHTNPELAANTFMKALSHAENTDYA
ncbi:MAG: indole-3-glycerol phosphate synthase [Crocinitomicaceae bacterium]|nr:indole-3-glycerol phosphate synthase [Crocinitomicaceae bacterium]|tara:strand:- start:3313 stop:4122 length:810 start_codon:yes stop_codon:yes gene_type:complete